MTRVRVDHSGQAPRHRQRQWQTLAAYGRREARATLTCIARAGGGAGDDRTGEPGSGGSWPAQGGHADREQVIEMLKNAFVHGRLTRDELDARAGRAITARTYAEPVAAHRATVPVVPQSLSRTPVTADPGPALPSYDLNAAFMAFHPVPPA